MAPITFVTFASFSKYDLLLASRTLYDSVFLQEFTCDVLATVH